MFTGRGGSTAGFVDSADASSGVVGIVLSDTSFYYESGGQVFDTGVLQLQGADGECAGAGCGVMLIERILCGSCVFCIVVSGEQWRRILVL